jgi:lipoate-protein ligase A
MSTEALQLEPLGPQDAALLTALFTASDAFTPWVEVGAFRHAQLKRRKDIDRLERLGYIRKERIRSEECYRVSLTALAQLREHPVIAEVLDVAEAMWMEFRDHFEKARGEPLALSAVAEAIGKSTDFTELVYVYMLNW